MVDVPLSVGWSMFLCRSVIRCFSENSRVTACVSEKWCFAPAGPRPPAPPPSRDDRHPSALRHPQHTLPHLSRATRDARAPRVSCTCYSCLCLSAHAPMNTRPTQPSATTARTHMRRMHTPTPRGPHLRRLHAPVPDPESWEPSQEWLDKPSQGTLKPPCAKRLHAPPTHSRPPARCATRLARASQTPSLAHSHACSSCQASHPLARSLTNTPSSVLEGSGSAPKSQRPQNGRTALALHTRVRHESSRCVHMRVLICPLKHTRCVKLAYHTHSVLLRKTTSACRAARYLYVVCYQILEKRPRIPRPSRLLASRMV